MEDVVPAEIAESELIKALEEALCTPTSADKEGYYTTKELHDMTGYPLYAVRILLGKLGEIGRLESTYVMRHSFLLDRPTHSRGYRLKAQGTQDENKNEEADNG